jgi:uncharacterized protein (TIGR02145 family)
LILNLNLQEMIYTTKFIRNITLLALSILLIVSCKKVSLPGVTTAQVTRILQRSAYSGGQVISDGGAQITARGVCWNISIDPTLANNKSSDSIGFGLFTSYISGLTASTTYYVRAYATNSEGTSYGENVEFTTDPPDIPTLNTLGLKSVTLTTASGGGEISNDGGLTVTARGVCWNTQGAPTIADSHSSDGNGSGLFTSILTDLTLNTTYHIRAYATNSLGTGYGSDVEFTQMEPITDNDGNTYSIVTIGTQVWLGDNLKTTTFNDGSSIPYVSTANEWVLATTPAFCWYNNSETDNKATYGGLYNWYAVNTGKLCPTGWHVPSVDEYTTLLNYLGGAGIAGGKLKETGTVHWADPNLGATNGSSFTALPGGGRYNLHSEGGTFADIGYYGYFWSSTSSTTTSNAYSYDMYFDLNLVSKDEFSKKDGGSVRCIKNSQ